MMKSIWLVLFFVYCSGHKDSFVITTESSKGKEDGPQGGNFGDESVPKIYEMQIESNISNRFAQTLITSKVRNWNDAAREATFSVILPDKAYISEFTMVIKGKSYKAYVKEKEKAKQIYEKAVASGLGAAQVALTARESSQFTVSVNVEALGKATFLLKYEELLRLKDYQYELVINIQPNQPVNDLYVNVMINESIPLKFIRTPPLRSENEICKFEGDLDPRASVFRLDSKSAVVQFKPNIEKQKEFAKHLGTDVSKGLSGQFVVQYDVERDLQGGEVLVKDGYFVHFFAPSGFKPLNKFVVFVLDTSRSMAGRKIEQIKQAMLAILEQLDPNDYFHIVNSESYTKVLNVINSDWCRSNVERNYPRAFPGHHGNIKKAKKGISSLRARGKINIHEALQLALNLIEAEEANGSHEYLPQPIIMFLTDGGPSIGVTNTDQIVKDITKRNDKQVPIYTLSFGDRADKDFLKKVSLNNHGFSRHIYEAPDAAMQLENFYKEISSPLLSGVKFEYVPDATSLTKTKFPLHFGGSELIVAGRLHTSTFPELPRIMCSGRIGPVTLHPSIERPITSLERLWAYLTVQQLLDEEEEIAQNEKKALDLALKYSFVTPVSSLIVVRPNSTDCNIEPKRLTRTKGKSRWGSRRREEFRSLIGYHFQHPSRGSKSHLIASRPIPASRRHSPERLMSDNKLTNQKTKLAISYALYHRRRLISDTFSFDRGEQTIGDIGYSDPSFRDRLVLLKLLLPWLENCLHENGTLKSPPGGYKLGLNKTFLKKPSCSETPTNTTGHCELLDKCPQVYHLLTTEDVFVRYFCPLKRRRKQFAGVCCP